MIETPRSARWVGLCVVVGASVASAVATTGCGIKGPPQPPLIRIADTTRDLNVFQEGTDAVLSWSYPSSTTSGDPLPDVEAVEIWRATMLEVEAPPPGQNPRDRNLNKQLLESTGERIAALDTAGLEAATRGPMLEYRDDLDAWRATLETVGDDDHMIWYAVRTVCCRGRESEMSNIARIPPAVPPPAPRELAVSAEADGLRLTWLPHDELPVVVERSPDGERWHAVTAKPLATGEWLDVSAEQDATWSYRLRSVQRRRGAPRVVGDAGASVRLDYPDIYPPDAPKDLVCLPEGQRVGLRWLGGDAAVIYHVSRRTDGGAATSLADDIQANQFEDDDPPTGTLTYQVTAIDEAGNESEVATCTAARGSVP
jgi:hypothetical protein